jgi:hypothetical protein
MGIRGAEWANVVWCRLNPRVRILDPDPPAKRVMGLFAQLGIRYEFANVSAEHCYEDPLEALRFLTEP